MRLEIGETALITTEDWFIAPDGKQYKSVFGTVHSVLSSEETLGVKTNARSTNWYVEIGNMTVAGCQIHYAIRCSVADMNFDKVTEGYVFEGKGTETTVASRIYNANRLDQKEKSSPEIPVNEESLVRDEKPRCHAGRDGDCIWEGCPQIRDNELESTRRHCPLDSGEDPYQ